MTMQRKIKNIIYKGIRTNINQTPVYGYLYPTKAYDRAVLVSISDITTNHYEVYLDSLEVYYEDDNFGEPVNIYELTNKQ